MNIPNLPTDNLYKFYSITGIFVTLLSVIVMLTYLWDSRENASDILINLQKTELESTFLKEDIKVLDAEINDVTNSLKKLNLTDENDLKNYINTADLVLEARNDKNTREYLEFFFKHRPLIFPELEKFLKIKVLEKDILKKQRTLEVKNLELALTFDYKYDKNLERILMFIIFISSFILGVLLAKIGFREWINKVQKPMDRKLAIELLKLEKEMQDSK